MKQNKEKQPSTKNSFFEMYKGKFTIYAIIVVYFIALGCLILVNKYTDVSYPKIIENIANFIIQFIFPIIMGISTAFFSIIFVFAIYEFIKSRINQCKVPLSNEEMNNLNIHNAIEYDIYLRKFLHDFKPNEQIFLRLIISAYHSFLKDSNNIFDINEIIKCKNADVDLNKDDVIDIHYELEVVDEETLYNLITLLLWDYENNEYSVYNYNENHESFLMSTYAEYFSYAPICKSQEEYFKKISLNFK